MHEQPIHVDTEEVLRHTERLRELVRHLVRDDATVDDVLQEARLVSLTRPRSGEAPLYAWLAGVVRNLARRERRTVARRARREGAVARPEVGSEPDLVERADFLECVLGEMRRLDEPYRTTLLLRFVDGREPDAIAREASIPGATVRSRVKRGLELLRHRLDERHGGSRTRWLGACAAMIGDPDRVTVGGAGLSTAVVGGLAMATAKYVAAVAVLILGGAIAWWASATPRDQRPMTIARGPDVIDRMRGVPQDRTRRAGVAGTGGAQGASASPASIATSGVGGRVRGRVLLPSGEPLPNAAVVLAPPHATEWVLSDGEGRFELIDAQPGAPATLWVVAQGWRASRVAIVTARADAPTEAADVTLEADPPIRVRGLVRSGAGLPLTGARVDVRWSAVQADIDAAGGAERPSLAAVLLATRDDPAVAVHRHLSAPVRADGSFEISVPVSAGQVGLAAVADGHLSARRDPSRAVSLAEAPIEFVLNALPRARGTVLDGDGTPIAGAKLGFHAAVEISRRTVQWLSPPWSTDAAGRFDVVGVPQGGTYLVVQSGDFPLWYGEPPAGQDLRITLRRHDMSIAGVVMLRDGTPVADVDVRTHIPSSGVGSFSGWGSARTDPMGRFELTELPAGNYVVHARPASGVDLRQRLLENVPAGTTDLRIVMEPGESIAGIVVDERGAPLAGVSVWGRRADGERITGSAPGGWGDAGHASAVSDADGRFTLFGLDSTSFIVQAGVLQSAGEYRRPARVDDVRAGSVDVRLTLTRGGSISGVIVDEDGRPVAERTVHALPPDAAPLAGDYRGPCAATDREGRFTITGLEETATYWLRLEWPYGAPDQRIWLRGGEAVRVGNRDVRLVLVEGGSIAGVLVDAAGEPVAKKMIWLTRDKERGVGPGQGYRAWTDERGRFEIRNIPPGRTYGVACERGRIDGISPGARELVLKFDQR